MTTIKKGDWIELDFVARIQATNKIFDLTDEKLAKKEGIHQQGREYKPLTVKVGAGYLLGGLDKFIPEKEIGKEYEIDIQPEDAFGKRNGKLINLVSLKKLKDQKINPYPGLQIQIDGALATVRSVSGGRVVIDFNHPLSGKIVHYKFKILRRITDEKEQIQAVLRTLLGLQIRENYDLEIKDKKATITFKTKTPLGGELSKNLAKELKKQVEGLADLQIKEAEKEDKKKEEKPIKKEEKSTEK